MKQENESRFKRIYLKFIKKQLFHKHIELENLE